MTTFSTFINVCVMRKFVNILCQTLNTVHSPVSQWNTVTLTFTCSSVFLQFEALKTITPVCPNLIDTHMCAFPIKYCTV